eukprot:TRINITY_DN8152_c0_g1_i6.p1 TRINITY_DN8152_c0_g1~~TRINITY_DN8152_c0_g1_i6.p1  ORF type:complete len:109 (+),score=12.81 TRINITY_DN8152_c0_g1_i6:1-327(+)
MKFQTTNSVRLVVHLITLSKALAGFEGDIMHLDDHFVPVSRTSVTKPGTTVMIEGEGMPIASKSGRGSLHITFDVDFPYRLTASQKKSLKTLFEGVRFDVGKEIHDEL